MRKTLEKQQKDFMSQQEKFYESEETAFDDCHLT
jgi:hypothetical protein